MAVIKIPTPLRKLTDGEKNFVTNGANLGICLSDLMDAYPMIEPHLFKDGKVPSYIKIFLGETDVRELEGLETAIKSSDTISIVPAIAGGTEDIYYFLINLLEGKNVIKFSWSCPKNLNFPRKLKDLIASKYMDRNVTLRSVQSLTEKEYNDYNKGLPIKEFFNF